MGRTEETRDLSHVGCSGLGICRQDLSRWWGMRQWDPGCSGRAGRPCVWSPRGPRGGGWKKRAGGVKRRKSWSEWSRSGGQGLWTSFCCVRLHIWARAWPQGQGGQLGMPPLSPPAQRSPEQTGWGWGRDRMRLEQPTAEVKFQTFPSHSGVGTVTDRSPAWLTLGAGVGVELLQ